MPNDKIDIPNQILFVHLSIVPFLMRVALSSKQENIIDSEKVGWGD